jgi:hypothetical protein
MLSAGMSARQHAVNASPPDSPVEFEGTGLRALRLSGQYSYAPFAPAPRRMTGDSKSTSATALAARLALARMDAATWGGSAVDEPAYWKNEGQSDASGVPEWLNSVRMTGNRK